MKCLKMMRGGLRLVGMVERACKAECMPCK